MRRRRSPRSVRTPAAGSPRRTRATSHRPGVRLPMPADRHRARSRVRAVVVLVTTLATVVLGACSGSSTHAKGGPGHALRIATYVALGDSYTAAPFVPTTDLARGCLRSDHNYPALLARSLGAKLRDASCSGATTADARGRQVLGYGDLRSRMRPQIDSV